MNCDEVLQGPFCGNQFISAQKMKLLIIGAGGMLGNTLVRYFGSHDGFSVFGTVRSGVPPVYAAALPNVKVFTCVDVDKQDDLIGAFRKVHPDVVINAVGFVKQLAAAFDPLVSIPINALFPHRLAHLCSLTGARLIHISTDCVFSGMKGMYTESDSPDAFDLYGRSKFLGEVDYPLATTLRTSMIGHELVGARSLLCWFLSQKSSVKGYRRAVFSGLPTVEIARVIRDFVLTHPELHGVYHLSADPISKYDLLTKVADVYGKSIEIVPDDSLVLDRSLDSSCFRAATGFVPKSWDEMIVAMRDFG